jgi:hypothetical protein
MFSAAFANYEEAGRIKLKRNPYRPEQDWRKNETMQKVYAGRTDIGAAGYASRQPIFVLGMPRSGTSLLEQVMSSHSEIAGIGEQQLVARLINGVRIAEDVEIDTQKTRFWPEDYRPSLSELGEKYIFEARKQMRKEAEYTLDKMPPNYRYVGFIRDMLPDATIIHSMRHPVETCISCYRILFADGHEWSYNLHLLGKRYRFYYEQMQNWDEIFGDQILHVRYEDMISDLEHQVHRLLDRVGVKFEEQCLQFHENPNPMRTASALQVRQPLYTSSVDKWQKHRDLLGPLYDEIGDIIDMYEARQGLFSRAG